MRRQKKPTAAEMEKLIAQLHLTSVSKTDVISVGAWAGFQRVFCTAFSVERKGSTRPVHSGLPGI